MSPQVTVLDPLPVEVPRPLVLLRLGYRRPDQVPARTVRGGERQAVHAGEPGALVLEGADASELLERAPQALSVDA